MRQATVYLKASSEEVLRDGLMEFGLDLDNISDEQLGKMLTYALGFVDYSDPSVVQELLDNSK